MQDAYRVQRTGKQHIVRYCVLCEEKLIDNIKYVGADLVSARNK